MRRLIILTLIFLGMDVISKIIISSLFNEMETMVIIKNFFNLTYVKNTGIAWSMLNDKTFLITIITLVLIIGIIIYVYKNKPKDKMEIVSDALIIGGALGNLLDRIIYGYVIDFLDFNIFGYDYPIFNLADSFIVIGVILLLVYSWRHKDGNFS